MCYIQCVEFYGRFHFKWNSTAMPHDYNRAEVEDVFGQSYRYVLEIVLVS